VKRQTSFTIRYSTFTIQHSPFGGKMTPTVLGIILGLLFSPAAIAVADALARGDAAYWRDVLLRGAVLITFALFVATTRAAGGRELALYISWR
jgi:hypothetical protein